MRKLRVAIWDDRQDQLKALLSALKAATSGVADIDVVDCSPHEISQHVDNLKSAYSASVPERIPFLDDLDVLCIDYDLRMLEGQTWLTADVLAGLVRAYSDCACVIALNRPPRVAFDLTMVGSWDGPGDIQTIPAVIASESFWTPPLAEFPPRFRCWGWPEFRVAKEILFRQIADLEAIDDIAGQDVFAFFGFDRDHKFEFSYRALGALSPKVKSEDPRLTFADFLETGVRALPPEKLREISLSRESTRRVACRLVAFELGRWLREQVLAAQDVLVDVPHLAARAPWLIGGDKTDVKTWNDRVFGSFDEHWMSAYSFPKDHWLGRRAYFWSKIQSDHRFVPNSEGDIKDTEPQTYGDFVFLEDASSFAPRTMAREFTASFGNVWDQRFVMDASLIDPSRPYGPLVRFAV